MNFFGRKTSKPPAARAGAAKPQVETATSTTTVLRTVSELQQTIDRIDKRTVFLQQKADASKRDALARKRANDQKGAILHLRRHNMFQKEVTSLENQKMILEQQKLAIESSSLTTTVVKAMQTGATQQKALAKALDPDALADLQDDIAENLRMTDDVLTGLSVPLDGVEDSALMADLDALEDLDGLDEAAPQAVAAGEDDELNELARLGDKLPKLPGGGELPLAPTGKAAVPKKAAQEEEEDPELAELAGLGD